MSSLAVPRRSVVANAIYGLLNPIPFGFFVAALIFDIIYARTGVMLWDKGAAWLIAIGLLFAIVPRLINLVQVWITSRRTATARRPARLLAQPGGHRRWRSSMRSCTAATPTRWCPPASGSRSCTVVLLAIGHLVIAVQTSAPGDFVHE